jgi:hypothetical protein
MNKFIALFALLAVASATSFNVVNQCSYGITVYTATSVGNAPLNGVGIGPGGSAGGSTSDWAGNFYANGQPASLAEFSINQWGGQDFYDISLIVGFNMGIQISPSSGNTLTCYGSPCSDAYMTPNENYETNGTGTGGSFTIAFCP